MASLDQDQYWGGCQIRSLAVLACTKLQSFGTDAYADFMLQYKKSTYGETDGGPGIQIN